MAEKKQYGWDGGNGIYEIRGGLPFVPDNNDSYGKFLRSYEKKRQSRAEWKPGECLPSERRKRKAGPA